MPFGISVSQVVPLVASERSKTVRLPPLTSLAVNSLCLFSKLSLTVASLPSQGVNATIVGICLLLSLVSSFSVMHIIGSFVTALNTMPERWHLNVVSKVVLSFIKISLWWHLSARVEMRAACQSEWIKNVHWVRDSLWLINIDWELRTYLVEEKSVFTWSLAVIVPPNGKDHLLQTFGKHPFAWCIPVFPLLFCKLLGKVVGKLG